MQTVGNNIEGNIWLKDFVDKIASKHRVETDEVEERFDNQPKIRFVEKGERAGEDIYLPLGGTDAGRYLTVLFIYKFLSQDQDTGLSWSFPINQRWPDLLDGASDTASLTLTIASC